MSVMIDGKQVYRIGEALSMAGLSRATFFRWVKDERITDTRYRDRNGRRVFTEDELQRLMATAHRLVEASPQLLLWFHDITDRGQHSK